MKKYFFLLYFKKNKSTRRKKCEKTSLFVILNESESSKISQKEGYQRDEHEGEGRKRKAEERWVVYRKPNC